MKKTPALIALALLTPFVLAGITAFTYLYSEALIWAFQWLGITEYTSTFIAWLNVFLFYVIVIPCWIVFIEDSLDGK